MISKLAAQTGGGGDDLDTLTPLEERILGIMGKTAYKGKQTTIIEVLNDHDITPRTT